jgi:hypothetical protein
LLLNACAPVLPALSGGGTTPTGRVDVAVGGAARVPLGSLAAPERLGDAPPEREVDVQGFTRRGGLAPLVSVSLPLGDRTDLGFQAAGSALALSIRKAFPLGEQTRLIGGLAPFGGAVLLDERGGGGSAVGPRVGVNMPWVLALDVGGVYEGWVGARAGIEHARCRLEQERSELTMRGTLLRTGVLLGLGVGFRRLHALLELAADHEWWWMGGDIEPSRRSGLSLTPAFALRMRF